MSSRRARAYGVQSMDLRMLINARDYEECRIAITEDDQLVELEIESDFGRKLKGNIYKARISRIEPSLQAAFIDIGTERNGFLQINDIHPSYFPARYAGDHIPSHKINIQDVLQAGQELIVQVVKEERELKGATLTTYLSLPGRYIVVMPGSDRGGISRKIVDSEQRKRLKKLCVELEVPSGIGLIIRTAGLDRSQSELSRDLTLQLKLWERILNEAQKASSPSLLYKESDLATRVVRDYFTPEIRSIVIDDSETFQRVREFVDQVMPRYRSRVKEYTNPEPLLAHYNVEHAVASTMVREVALRSGGSLVIEQLEALVAIDVNSGKATAGGSIEDTAYRTNLEAADELARQLRLRDLGGLIVIDFIDMLDRRHKALVEKRLRNAIKTDKARVEVGKISKFGLLEMSRQRLRASLNSQSYFKCPNCIGQGQIRSPELVALEVLRKIQSAVVVGQVTIVKARLAPAPAMFLLNRKKAYLSALEKDYSIQIYVLADGRLRQDEYQFEMESRKGAVDAHAAHTITGTPPPPSARVEEEDEDEEEEEFEGETSRAQAPQAERRLRKLRLSRSRRPKKPADPGKSRGKNTRL